MTIPKQLIVATLRDRNLHARADWVDRELPDDVDPAKHSGLFATLNLDPKDLIAQAAS